MKKTASCLAILLLSLSTTAQTPRLSLVEEFTGETCPPCAINNPAFNTLLSNNLQYVVPIKWQVPIPSAPTTTWSLYQTNKAEINWRYSTYGYGIQSAPSVRIDGQMPTVFGAGGQNITQMSSSTFTAAQSYTSAFSITMNQAWNKSCSAVNLTITVQATAPFTSTGALKFRTVMVEKQIQFSVPPGSNGETFFEDVAIKSFPTIQSGTTLQSTWTNGQVHTFTLSCPIPSYVRDKEQIAFVGFIQDDGNRKVAQAVRTGTMALPPDALGVLSAEVDLSCTNQVTPSVVVKNENTAVAITAFTLTPYIDGLAGATTTWAGNLSAGSTAVIVMAPVSSPTLSGSHSFSCDIDISAGIYNMSKNATKITYMVAGNYQGTPVMEDFVTASFPPAGWGIVNLNAGPSWSKNYVTGGFNLSQESTKYDFYSNTVIGDKDELYLPPMNLTAINKPEMYFDMAYAQRDALSDDKLEVLVSDNCGISWTSVFSANGLILATTDPQTGPYTPDPSNPAHWRKVTIDMSAYSTKTNLLVKFETTSDNGNNLYLDNVNLGANTTGIRNVAASSLDVVLYPNPAAGTSSLKIGSLKAGSATLAVTNALGQVVLLKTATLNEGFTVLQIDLKEFSSGIYNVSVTSNGSTTVKKLSVIK